MKIKLATKIKILLVILVAIIAGAYLYRYISSNSKRSKASAVIFVTAAPPANIKKDDIFIIPFTIRHESKDLSAGNLFFEYNSTNFQYQHSEIVPALYEKILDSDNAISPLVGIYDRRVRIVVVNKSHSTDDLTSGVYINLKFKALKSGKYPIVFKGNGLSELVGPGVSGPAVYNGNLLPIETVADVDVAANDVASSSSSSSSSNSSSSSSSSSSVALSSSSSVQSSSNSSQDDDTIISIQTSPATAVKKGQTINYAVRLNNTSDIKNGIIFVTWYQGRLTTIVQKPSSCTAIPGNEIHFFNCLTARALNFNFQVLVNNISTTDEQVELQVAYFSNTDGTQKTQVHYLPIDTSNSSSSSVASSSSSSRASSSSSSSIPSVPCECDVAQNCSTSCPFSRYDTNQLPGVAYDNPIKCGLGPLNVLASRFISIPTASDRNKWCARSDRTKGDTNGDGRVNGEDSADYQNFVMGRKINPNSNPDVNGDGKVSIEDRDIIVKTRSGN